MNPIPPLFLAAVALLLWQTWQSYAAALNATHARNVQRRLDERWINAFIARENAKRKGRDRWGRFKSSDARQHNLDAVAEAHTEGRTRDPRRTCFDL